MIGWDEPATTNWDGSRLVVMCNWMDPDEACKMLFDRGPDGSVVITTCRKDMAPIRWTAEQAAAIAGYLRAEPGGV